MKRSFLLLTAWLTTVLLSGGGLHGEDDAGRRQAIGRGLEMYRWLIDHEEFRAAGKLAAEMQANYPEDALVQLLVENAQLRAAVREANRVLIDDAPAPTAASGVAPALHWEMTFPWEAPAETSSDPFHPDINWRELGNISGSAPVTEPDFVQASGVESDDTPPRLFDAAVDGDPLSRIPASADDEQGLSAEARIWMALTKPISLDFNDAPLSDVMRHVSKVCNVNVVIDEIGLQEEGVTSETPVTIVVNGIQARSALSLVLWPLNLAYRIEDEVIKVTSHNRSLGVLLTRVYAVPDLVTPIPHHTPGSVRDKLERLTEPSTAEFDALIDLITTTVHPDSWSHAGGRGSISKHDGTLSLVIRQTRPAHNEIGDLLSQVRQLRDVQVSHTLHRLSVPVSELGVLGLSGEQTVHVVAADEKSEYELQFLGEGAAFDVQALPRITLFNRQTGTVADTERTVLINSVAAPDRRTVRINVAVPETLEPGDVMSAVRSADVPDGGIALLLMSDAARLLNGANRAEVLAVTPRIQVAEEEEQLLGLPVR